MPTCPAWSARRCRRRCRGRTWSRGRGRCWGRGSWTGSWAAAAHTPAAGRSCSRSENITITIRKYLLEKKTFVLFFPIFLLFTLWMQLWSCWYLWPSWTAGPLHWRHSATAAPPLQQHCNLQFSHSLKMSTLPAAALQITIKPQLEAGLHNPWLYSYSLQWSLRSSSSIQSYPQSQPLYLKDYSLFSFGWTIVGTDG